MDTLRSAEKHSATLCNYTRFVDAKYAAGVWECEVEQTETEQRAQLTAKCVVNAAGPWSHKIPNSHTTLRLTKGVHLVIDRVRLPVPDAVVLTEKGRILFVIPWRDRVILGTTDTDYDGDIGSPTCDPEDVQYVLDSANDAFPSAKLTTVDVRSTWAGLRPLVADKRGNPSDISRRHEVKMSNPAWWDVTGGKLTTYRLMAEETVDAIVRFLGIPKTPCMTATTPLLFDSVGKTVSGVFPPEVRPKVVEHFCGEEWARHLDDVMIRRTSWRYYHLDHMVVAEQVAGWMSQHLGWSDEERDAELARYRELIGDTSAHVV